MFTFGILTLVFGWAFMFLGVGAGSAGLGFQVANLHAMNVALGLIITGGAFVVAGAAHHVADRITRYATWVHPLTALSREMPTVSTYYRGAPAFADRDGSFIALVDGRELRFASELAMTTFLDERAQQR